MIAGVANLGRPLAACLACRKSPCDCYSAGCPKSPALAPAPKPEGRGVRTRLASEAWPSRGLQR
jgi:hypothetical protein